MTVPGWMLSEHRNWASGREAPVASCPKCGGALHALECNHCGPLPRKYGASKADLRPDLLQMMAERG